MLRSLSKYYSGMVYDIDRIYEASGYVVVVADARAKQRTSSGDVEVHGQIVTVLKVVGEKIVEHRDYYDYKGASTAAKTKKKS